METTKNQIIRTVTEDYLSNMDPTKTDNEIEAELMDAVKNQFELHNCVADKGQKWHYPEYLEVYQIAKILEKK